MMTTTIVSHFNYCILTSPQTMATIFRRLGLSDPGNWNLTTLRGYVLNEEEPLAAYGLGSLFESWELLVTPKPTAQQQPQQKGTNIITNTFVVL
jgi:hypothetical protein